MPNTTPLPKCDVLVLAWEHVFQVNLEGQSRYIDPLWSELTNSFEVRGRAKTYRRNFDAYATDLQSFKIWQEERDEMWLLHPNITRRSLGTYYEINKDGKKIILFRSNLLLNNCGPSMPSIDLMKQLITESEPGFVITASLGGATESITRTGDVKVSSSAKFLLRLDLDGSLLNEQTFGGLWQIDPEIFSNLRFEEITDPSLQAPSPNYQDPDIVVPAHRPKVSLSEKPILTAPMMTEPRFRFGILSGRNDLSNEGCVSEMDSATVAMHCHDSIPFAGVVGIATPALVNFSFDYSYALQKGWGATFINRCGKKAAENCAQSVLTLATANIHEGV